MSRWRLPALALAATVLVASGCGESAGSSKRLTRSELIAQGDVICRRLNTRLASATLGGGDLAQIMLPLAAYEHAAVVELHKLTPPASMARDWGQVISGAKTLADATAKLGEYAKTHNNKLFNTGPSTRAVFTAAGEGTQRMNAAAQREGFSDCARIR